MRRRYLGRGSAVLAALALTGTVVAAAPAAPSGGGGRIGVNAPRHHGSPHHRGVDGDEAHPRTVAE